MILRTLGIITITTALLLAALPAVDAEDQVETAKLSPEVRAAIDRGLVFLASRQQDDGRFVSQGSDNGQHPVCDTALALMAFMVQGHVPGRDRKSVV